MVSTLNLVAEEHGPSIYEVAGERNGQFVWGGRRPEIRIPNQKLLGVQLRGDDEITTGVGRDIILAGAGMDTITANVGEDLLGDPQNPIQDGNNLIIGDHGFVDYVANDNDAADIDQIWSTQESDPDLGAADTITTGFGNDIIIAGQGPDDVVAGNGTNLVIGDNGRLTSAVVDDPSIFSAINNANAYFELMADDAELSPTRLWRRFARGVESTARSSDWKSADTAFEDRFATAEFNSETDDSLIDTLARSRVIR